MAPSRLLANVTLALAVLASLLLQVALYDRQAIAWPGWSQLAVAVLITLAATRWSHRSPWAYAIIFGSLAILPFVCDRASRALLGYGDPYEVQVAYNLRNLMLGLAALRSETRTQHFAGLASFFLVLFSFLWSMSLATTVLLVAYSLVGMWWLLGCYWDGIQGRFADKSEQAIPVQPSLIAVGIVVVLLLAALPIARSSRVATALQGFFPSSGGTTWSDDFAHGGVGDGNQMVAAKDDASSFGAVESELFLESKKPSLYDVFNETSDSKVNKQKRGRRRAIPLAPTSMQQNHEKLGKNQQSNREFDAVRSRPQQRKKNTRDYTSPSLLQVRGRVPVHLGMYAYDTWDGQTLGWSGADAGVYRKLDKNSPDGRSWLRLSVFCPEPLFDHTEQHHLRIINLDSARVPSPPNLTALNVDYLHDVNMFRCMEDGNLALDASTIPQLTVLNVESRRLPREAEPPLFRTEAPEETGRIGTLAKQWTKGVEPGWPQVAAICDRLHEEYQLDPDAVAPADCEEAAEYFLFEAKRGPNYLFATSAALLVRSLGYETRVKAGFYARAENYDRLSNLTSIYKEDAHFWFEVLSTGGISYDREGESRLISWIAAEPTPGYESLYTPDTLFASCYYAARDALRAVADRPGVSALVAAAITAVVWFRVLLLDGLVTAWWSVAYRLGDARHQVLATVRLLERRAWLRGRPRPRGATIGRWELFDSQSSASPSTLNEFRRFASWAMYGDGAPAAAPAEQIQTSCREAARTALRSKQLTTSST